MPVFSYKAKQKSGKVVKGVLEAETKEKVVEFLHAQNSVVLSLTQSKSKKAGRSKGKVKTDELVIFSRQLTTLIESGISAVSAMDILVQQTDNLFFKRILGEISKDLKEGLAFAPSLAKHPKIFPEIYISMVEAAEISGNLPQILDRLSVYLEKMSALRKKIIASLIYPAIVVIMTVSMTSFLLLKIIPTFKEFYEALGAELPLPTQVLIGLSDLLKNSMPFILIGIIVGVVFFKKYTATDQGKRNYHKFLIKLPLFGDVIKKVGVAKFARTFATLVRSGVQITAALDIVGSTSGNKLIEDAVLRAKKVIQEGVPLSQPLGESTVFPPMVIRMIAVGEKTGKLELMLNKIAQFYEEQTDAAIAGLTSALEPILIVFLGIIVGGIVIALFLPIINLSQAILRG